MKFVLVLISSIAFAQSADHWVPTWGASPQQPLAPQAVASNQPPPVTGFSNQTVRMIVHTSIGGRRVRVQFSNAFGTAPLAVGAAHIALRAKDSGIVAGSDRPLSFGGKPSFTIPAGALAVSDAADLDVPKLSDLAISVYLPGDTGPATRHALGLHTAYISKGDATSQPAIADAIAAQSLYFLSSVEVPATPDTTALLVFGDSITDGTRSTPETNSSWPSVLAQRLLANSGTANMAVLNEAIAGNRVLRDGAGISALARFDRDVLSQPGVKWMTLLEGINDIGIGHRTPAEAVTAADLIAGYGQIIARAHTHGIKVIGCTMTPYTGAAYYSDDGEIVRQAVNAWIRTSGAFDAVVDFDAATRASDKPAQLRPEFDSGDHLHPNDAGYKAMAETFDLSLFGGRPLSASSAKR